jgi:hypothetical protein
MDNFTFWNLKGEKLTDVGDNHEEILEKCST